MRANRESSGGDLTAQAVTVRALFRAAACSVALVDEAGENLVYAAASGEGSQEIVGVVLPVDRGIAGWAALAGQSIVVGNVRDDPRFARDVAEQTHYVPTTVMAAPMFQPDGEVLGVLSVLDPAIDQYDGWGLDVLGTLAAQIATIATIATSTSGAVGTATALGESTGGQLAEQARLAELGRRVLEVAEEFCP